MEIVLKDVSYSYGKRFPIQALRGITAKINPGIHLLLGENGAGKTTLLHVISGLLFPQDGVCKIDGSEPRFRLPSIMSRIAFLAADATFPVDTLQKMVEIHAQFYPRFSRELLAANLAKFGLSETDSLKSMSFGNRHKAMIAYILSLRTEIVLLDEPANGLDIESKDLLQRMVVECTDGEQTIIVSTHNISDLRNLYDGVIILRHGELQLAATVDDILQKVNFVIAPAQPARCLFAENRIGECACIVPNETGDINTDIDYHLLYNALRSNGGDDIVNLLK